MKVIGSVSRYVGYSEFESRFPANKCSAAESDGFDVTGAAVKQTDHCEGFDFGAL